MIPQFEPVLTDSDAIAVFDQVRSGWVGSGKRVEEWEESISKESSIRGALVSATTSGTAALMLAIESLELPKGSKILFPVCVIV